MNPRRQLEMELRQWLRNHHGVIGYAEARHIGASPAVVRTKADRGEWERMHRGVYRDTAVPPGPYQDLRAACVACAGFGVASHRSAAWVWGLLPEPPDQPEVTVLEGRRDPRGHSGFTIHRSRDLDLSRAVDRNGIVVTDPFRTLVDVAGAVLPRQLTEVVDNALARQLVTVAGLEAEIARLSRRGRNGVSALRRHLADRGFVGAPEPSVLEAHTRRLIGTTGLPTPTIERHTGEEGEYRLDLSWNAIGFMVEIDGYSWHFSPEHLQRDLTRRNELQGAGWAVLVYSWRQVLDEAAVADEIAAAYRGRDQRWRERH